VLLGRLLWRRRLGKEVLVVVVQIGVGRVRFAEDLREVLRFVDVLVDLKENFLGCVGELK
jgi:hypothetical protein